MSVSLSVYEKKVASEANFIVEETQAEGLVPFSVLGSYLNEGRGWLVNLSPLLVSILTVTLLGYMRYFLAEWMAAPLSE